MAPLLLEAAPADRQPRVGTLTLVLVLSPVRAPDGTLRVLRQEHACGQPLAAYLPPRHAWSRVVWNGGVMAREAWSRIIPAPGDEVWCFPQWSDFITPTLLIGIAVSTAVSIGLTALSYVLFPPAKPHINPPDEHTFSFEGIRTATGPGNVVPVIYGIHRVGGQLLQAFVEQSLTVLDTGAGSIRVTALANPPDLYMLLAMGEGPVADIQANTIEINGQPASNFSSLNLWYRYGTPDQTPISEFSETRNTFADGRDLPSSLGTDEGIVYTTTTAVTAFVANIVFNQGLFNVDGKGQKEDNSLTIAYRYRIHGTSTWSGWNSHIVNAQRTAPVRFGLRRQALPEAVYDIAFQCGGIRHTDDLHAKWVPTLESITEVQDGTEAYPNTALLGLRVQATDQLQGALPNVTVQVAGRLVRQGSFAAAEAWTDNPAWCVMDFLTHPRYGLGLPDSDIDLTAFGVWAAYCDDTVDGEPRHRFNYVLDRDGRAQALLLEMMGGSRTLLLKSEGLWIPRPTRNDPPVQLLSWATCSNVSITYTRDADRINVMEARFSNEEAHYNQDVLTWPTVEDWPSPMQKASLEIRGVTKPSRIMRALQFELNRRRFENVELEMDCALDAVVLQVHDIFRFSHPLPAWGESGRVLEGSTTTTVYLDQEINVPSGAPLVLYLKFPDDTVEARNPFGTDTVTNRLDVAVPYSQTPIPRDTVWAFGSESPDTAVRLFRVTALQRKSDTTVHLKAVVHNPSIYDEITATPLPVPPGLPNPLGLPPALTFLLATELTRVQASGASLRVVNLAWDVAGVGAGQAPYAGATILRKAELASSSAGSAEAGAQDLGSLTSAVTDDFNFVQLGHVNGYVLEFDDYSVISGGTYTYRVVPVSQRGIPNNEGAQITTIHVTGPTTPDFFPGTVQNLRLRGQAVGATTWEGRDVHVQWDPVPASPLFNDTFFVLDYVVHVWAPGQEYLMRYTYTTALEFHYTFAQNQEDQIAQGQSGARRDLEFWVWARTNTGRISLDPAHIRVANPPPDMSVIDLDTTPLFEAAMIAWDQYREPRDFDHYELHIDLMNPPIAIYTDINFAFSGPNVAHPRKVFPQGLVAGTTYYTYVLPYDTFGPGIATDTESFVPGSITTGMIDDTPPSTPTNLHLTTGTEVNPDGTIGTWVEASWDAVPEGDVAGYEVHFSVVTGGFPQPPTVYNPDKSQRIIHVPVPGGVTIRVKLLAFDKFHNVSPFSAETQITTGSDTIPPVAPTNLVAFGSIKSVALLWTPPPDLDYDYSQVWVSSTNNRADAIFIGTGLHGFVHDSLGANDTRYYWIRAVDTSGNVSAYHPASATAGVSGTAGQLDTTYISSLAADKIIAGTISALVGIGIANRIFLDGVNNAITVFDFNGVLRVLIGRLGTLSTQWGINLYDQTGALMWNFSTGATTAGISDAAVNAAKITAGVINATHMRTDTAVITVAAQIANAIIGDAHINNLSANKITTGILQALYYLGGPTGAIQLDGVNRGITVYDENNTLRCLLGHTDPSIEGWGLNIWNSAGQIMWSFTSGASELGIQDLAVTNAKIGNAAISNAKIGNLEVDSAKIANLTVGTGKIANNAVSASLLFVGSGGGNTASVETEYARITFPTLNPGDQVWLVGTCTAVGAGAGGAVTNLNLREDGPTGTLHQQANAAQQTSVASGTYTPMTVQGMYSVGSALTNKAFVLSTTGIGDVISMRLTGLRLQK